VFECPETGIWCIQFVSAFFSPFAFVVWRSHLNDVSSGNPFGVADTFAGVFSSGVLMFTRLPDIMPSGRSLKLLKGKHKYNIIKRRKI